MLLAGDYYDAVNGLLAGDGSDLLEAIVGTDYVGHAGVDETLERKDELLAHFEDLHSVFPRAHLEAQVVSSSVDLVVMRIELVGASQGMLLGTALQRPTTAPLRRDVAIRRRSAGRALGSARFAGESRSTGIHIL